MRTAKRLLGLVVVAAALTAEANERRFTFTYESATLPKGERELEVWMSPRLGRDAFYARFDQRLEFEVGITDRLMGALYLNAKGTAAPDEVGEIHSEFEFEGMSGELKYRLLDPVADPVGLAIYGEVTANPHELEGEAKLIADKRIGGLLLAANLVGEHVWEWEEVGVAPETKVELELDLAAAYFLTDRLSVGVELQNHNEVHEGEWEFSANYAGPVVAYSERTWWIAATLQAQLPSLKNGEDGAGTLVLDDGEKFHGRVLFALMF